MVFMPAMLVLAWENRQEFDALLQAFRDEYCPDGVSEEAAVFDLASLHWKKAGSRPDFSRPSNSGALALWLTPAIP